MAKRGVPNYGGRGRGGMGGGMDMNKLMQQAKKMQEQLESAQENAKNIVATATAGGGMVKVEATGDMQLRSLTIDPDALDPEDVELLQDMVLAAVNDALSTVSEKANQEVAQATGLGGMGGLDDPLAGLGGLGGLF